MIKYMVVTLLIVGIGMQFYRPQKNIQEKEGLYDLLALKKAPKDIRTLYTNACYDCHSKFTEYKWFDHIAPISWYVDSNIKKGLFALDFSEWNYLTAIEKEIMFSAIPFNIESERMPPKEYTELHPKSKLSKKDKTKMIQWLQQVKIDFLKKENMH